MGISLTEISLASIYSTRTLGRSSGQITAVLRSYGFRQSAVELMNRAVIYLINGVDATVGHIE